MIGKAFTITYLLFNYFQYDIATSSLIGREIQETEYIKLVERATQDSAGADKIKFTMKEMIAKGK